MEATQEKTQEIVKCLCGCGVVFNKIDNKGRQRRFVSGHNSRIANPRKKHKVKQTCKTCEKIYYRSPAMANRGKNTYCSNKCRSLNAYEWSGGEKNPNWKGGFNGVQNIRWSPEYNIWRKEVFKRDQYLCQECLMPPKYKNPLHAHHIVPFAESAKLRFKTNNGTTLCKGCHLRAHTK